MTGALVHVGGDGMLVLDQRDEDVTVGAVVLVPVDCLVSVRWAYRLRDRAAERRARVEADTAFLDRVRELAEPLAQRVRQVGTATVTGGRCHRFAAGTPRRSFSHHDRDDVAVPLDVLEARGDVLPRREA